MMPDRFQLERDLLSNEDWKMILDSLSYTRLKFENYDKYPTEEYKRQRIQEVSELISRIRELLRA